METAKLSFFGRHAAETAGLKLQFQAAAKRNRLQIKRGVVRGQAGQPNVNAAATDIQTSEGVLASKPLTYTGDANGTILHVPPRTTLAEYLDKITDPQEAELRRRYWLPHITDMFPDAPSYFSTFCTKTRYESGSLRSNYPFFF